MAKVICLVSAYDVHAGQATKESTEWFEKNVSERLANLCRGSIVNPDVIYIWSNKFSPAIAMALMTRPKGITILGADTAGSDVDRGSRTIYSVWNEQIKHALDKYGTDVYFTNSNIDDRFTPEGLGILKEALDTRDYADLVFGNVNIVDKDGKQTGVTKFDGDNNMDRLMRSCYISPMPMWRAELHYKYGMFDGDMKVAGDYDFWLRVAAVRTKNGEPWDFFCVNKVVGDYCEHEDQAEVRMAGITVVESTLARSRAKEILKENYNV